MSRILVVEDEPGIALGLQDDLQLEGYDVELIADGGVAATPAPGSDAGTATPPVNMPPVQTPPASEAVSPGDSMPNRLIRPGRP